jgi:hypothetical protein
MTNTPGRSRARWGVVLVLVAGALAGPLVALAGAQGNSGTANLNNPSYWEGLGYGTCTKTDNPPDPYPLGPPPPGSYWSLLILKAGSAASNDDWLTQIPNPSPGLYEHPSGKDLSYVIVCSKPGTGPTTTTTSTTTTVPGGSCDDYTPTMVTVDPMTVLAGGAVTIQGMAYPGDTVTATLSGPSVPPTTLGSAVAGPTGQFTINAVIPVTLKPGTYTITVSSTQCPTSTSVTVVVTGTTFSGCGVNEPARNLPRGSTVVWMLHTPSFSTSAPVTLRMFRNNTSYTLYSGPWPPSGQVTVTIPATAPTGQYTMEQTGTKSNGKGTMSKTCPVWVVLPTSPIAAAAPAGPGDGLPARPLGVALALGAGLYGLVRLGGRRARATSSRS